MLFVGRRTQRLCEGGHAVHLTYGVRSRPLGPCPPAAGNIILDCRSLEVGPEVEEVGVAKRFYNGNRFCLDRDASDFVCLEDKVCLRLECAAAIHAAVKFVWQSQDAGRVVIRVLDVQQPETEEVLNHVQRIRRHPLPGNHKLELEMADGDIYIACEGLCPDCRRLEGTEGNVITFKAAGNQILEIISIEKVEESDEDEPEQAPDVEMLPDPELHGLFGCFHKSEAEERAIRNRALRRKFTKRTSAPQAFA
jgi:hypothetical protein